MAKRSFFGYVKAAFSARPLGMPIPPNWIALAAIAMLASINVGFLLIGVGLELAYLLWLASNRRFQRWVDGSAPRGQLQRERMERMIKSLPHEQARRYYAIADKCREILQHQQSHGVDVGAQSDSLSRLVLIYLQLLVTQENLQSLLSEGENDLPRRINAVERQLRDKNISPELRNSLEGQLEILQHRLAGRAEAAQKLKFIAAELVRIQEQVELVREQSMLTSDPAAMTERIDGITGSLSQTGEWIRDQQRFIGRLDDITADPPPLLGPEAEGQTQ